MTKLVTILYFWLMLTVSIRQGMNWMTVVLLVCFLWLYHWAEDRDFT